MSLSSSPDKRLSQLVPAEKSGWLEKRGKLRKNFKRRWFVLRDNEMKYYKSDTDEHSQGKVILDGCAVEMVPESKYGKRFCFEINSPVQNRVFAIVAENAASMQDWMNAIRRSMLRIRRERTKTEAARRRSKIGQATSDGESSSEPSQTSASGTNSTQSDAGANSAPTADGSAVAAAPRGSKGDAPKTGEGKEVDDKYGVYILWMEETKNDRRKSGMKNVHDGDMHKQLVEGDENEKGVCGPCSNCVIL